MIGVIEGFFGPEWSKEARLSYAQFLAAYDNSFYIYAPKRDQNLRRQWRSPWSSDYLYQLKSLKHEFSKNQVRFGVGLSPFGIEASAEDDVLLAEKARLLQQIGVEILGVFFDDMEVTPALAEKQIRAVKKISENFKGRIVFCPSFYSDDAILEKVFGAKPAHYLEDLAANLPPEIDFIWTGPKVISTEIPQEHLTRVNGLLRRKPFLWENLFANDGPKRCKILALQAYTGRSPQVLDTCSAVGFNLMNEPYLSQIVLHGAVLSLKDGLGPELALDKAIDEICSPEFGLFLKMHSQIFLNKGLDGFDETQKQLWIAQLESFSDLAAKDIIDWLEGKYIVGPECLTD